MALNEKLHQSAQKVVEQHVVPREQKTARAREGEEYKSNALNEALRGRKTHLDAMRTVSPAPVPQVVFPDLSTTPPWSPSSCARFSWRGRRRGRKEQEKEEVRRKKVEEEELEVLLLTPLTEFTPPQRKRLEDTRVATAYFSNDDEAKRKRKRTKKRRRRIRKILWRRTGFLVTCPP